MPGMCIYFVIFVIVYVSLNLFSSGLIAGSALVGVGLALMASYSRSLVETLEIGYKWMGSFDSIASLIIFAGLALLLWRFINKRQ